MIKALVISGVRLYREGLSALIDEAAELCVVASVGTAEEALVRGTYDVALVDAMRRDDVAAVRLLATEVDCPIVAFAVPDEDGDVIELAEAGVLGFVGRDATLDELVAAVRSAVRGEASVPPRVATVLLQRVSMPPAPGPTADVASLTGREREIVQIIGEGLTNKEIAARLSIEVATVKNHVHNILEKLQVSRRTEAVARLRLVEPAAPELGARAEAAERGRLRSTAL